MDSLSSHSKKILSFLVKSKIWAMICSLGFSFLSVPAFAYVDFSVDSVTVNGPYSHIKGSPSPNLSVSVNLNLETDENLLCALTVPVNLDLYLGDEVRLTETYDISICDLLQNMSFPLGDEALVLDDQYSIQVTVDSTNSWNESDEGNNNLGSAPFPYGILSGKLKFGTIATTLQSGSLNHFPGNCSTPLSLFGGNGHWNIEGNWPQAPYSTWGEVCVSSVNSEDGYSLDLSVASGSSVSTGTINSTAPIRGFGVSLTGTSLGSDGLDVDQVVLTMPDNISVHKEMVLNQSATPTTWIDPSGASTLIVHPVDQVAHPELIVGVYEAGSVYFHDYSLPFYVKANSASIDFTNGNGLRLIGVNVEGIHFRAASNMHNDDLRKELYGMFPDNRNFFFAGSSTSDIFINENGIQGSFSFAESAAFGNRTGAETSFPHTLMSWQSFDLTVQNGRIQQSPIMIDSCKMEFNTACPDDTCSNKVLPASYTLSEMEGIIAQDGAFGSRTTMSGYTRWGKYTRPQYTFERADINLPTFLYLPGSVVTGSSASPGTPEQRTIFQYLLGSRNYTEDGSLTANTLNYLDSQESAKGNDFFPGLTLGPQYLLNGNNAVEDGLTVSLEQPQHILFNGQLLVDTFQVYPSCKYVVRPGGLTGVFNLITPSAPEGKLIKIYGYELFLHRFAFRQVLNRIDTRTFIDGKLDLPYPAEVTPYFVDLDLSCSGDFGQGVVDSEENCNGYDDDGDNFSDEGCYQSYSYWNIPINYLAIGFAPDDPDQLCESRKLSLTVGQEFERLNKKLQHTAFWNTEGKPSGESMSGPAGLIVDGLNGNDGFPAQIQNGYLNHLTNYSGQDGGFANIVSRIGLPLFNAPVAHTHLRNSTDDDSGLITMFKNETENDADKNGVPDIAAYGDVNQYRILAQSNAELLSFDPRLRAKYNWPSSNVLKLDYPLNYQAGQSDKVPRFNGVKQETSFLSNTFPLVKTNTVPDFLEPKNLKISMGVSADVAFLKNLTLDIRSPEDVNNFFNNSLNPPLNIDINSYIGTLSDSSEKMDSMTGGDLSPSFRTVMENGLESGAAAQAMEDMAESLTVIQTSPYAFSTLLNNRIDGLIKAVVQRTGSNAPALNTEKLTYLYNNLAACTLFAGSVTQQNRLLEEIESGNISALNGLSTTDVETYFSELNGMVQNISELRDVIARYRKIIKKNHDGVEHLRQDIFMTDVNSPRLALESALTSMTGFQENSIGNPFFNSVADAQSKLNKVRDDIAGVSLKNLGQALKAGALSAGASLDTSQLPDMDRLLNSRVDELTILLAEADTLLRSKMSGLAFPTVFDKAKTRLQNLETQANSIKSDVISASNMALNGVFINVDTILKWYENNLDLMLEALSKGMDADSTITAANNSWAELVSRGQGALDKTGSTAIAGAKKELKISPSGSGSPFVSYWKLFAMLNTPLNAEIKDIGIEIDRAAKTAEKLIPAPRREDIQNVIVADVMNSTPVIDLNTLFHDQFVHMTSYIDMMTGGITGQANMLIKRTVAAIDGSLQQQLKGQKITIGDYKVNEKPAFGNGGISVTGLTGYATVRQNEISRFHMEGDFDINAQPSSTSYTGALDITSWNAKNGKGDCGLGSAATGLVDVGISTYDVPINILGTSINLKEAVLGFTLDGSEPIGINGRIYTSGEIGFEALVLYDMGLDAGVGRIENYFAATCAGRFDSYQIKAAFYLGKSCGMQVLGRLDPEIAEFIGSRPSITGVYARGGTSFPVYGNGCFLRVGVGAEIGAWLFAESPSTYGGLLGGSVYGQAVCIGSIKGKLTMIGGKTGDIFKFAGHGWGAAGIGFCSPGSWETVGDSRADSWCVTGDASFRGKATAKTNGSDIDISFESPDVSCCY